MFRSHTTYLDAFLHIHSCSCAASTNAVKYKLMGSQATAQP